MAVSVITALLIFELVKKREMAESTRLQKAKEKDDRIREEVLNWANPILGTVQDLRERLGNVLRHQAYSALHPEYTTTGQWSISYDYFINSTLYYFGVYFAYALALRNSLSFELFQAQEEKDELLRALNLVDSALGQFPPSYRCSGQDQQVFSLEQRSIGFVLLRDNNGNQCVSYPEFRGALEEGKYAEIFSPLKKLLERLTPSPDDCRWKRLEIVDLELAKVDEVCRKVLSPRRA